MTAHLAGIRRKAAESGEVTAHLHEIGATPEAKMTQSPMPGCPHCHRHDKVRPIEQGDLLGRLLDTFVAAQLRAELSLARSRPRLFHLRQEQGRHEVDLLAELSARDVVAIEVKADAAPRKDAAKHLAWLRDRLGRRFLRGAVLHTGPRAYELEDRIVAVPISTLWA